VETDLQQLQRDRFELLQRLETVEDQVKRLEITAPVTGTVVDLAIHTVGGTVAPGAQLLEIVPKDDPLVIDAQVRPEDVENIHPGLAVEVRMPGFEGRHLPLLTGTVVMVSADRLWDRSPGSAPFFQVRVQLDDQAIRHLASSKLRPGVPVDLMILTGEQSPIEYLTGPLARFFRRAMRN
jgi:HlyD family type I secretion membrane fusion protein